MARPVIIARMRLLNLPETTNASLNTDGKSLSSSIHNESNPIRQSVRSLWDLAGSAQRTVDIGRTRIEGGRHREGPSKSTIGNRTKITVRYALRCTTWYELGLRFLRRRAAKITRDHLPERRTTPVGRRRETVLSGRCRQYHRLEIAPRPGPFSTTAPRGLKMENRSSHSGRAARLSSAAEQYLDAGIGSVNSGAVPALPTSLQ